MKPAQGMGVFLRQLPSALAVHDLPDAATAGDVLDRTAELGGYLPATRFPAAEIIIGCVLGQIRILD